MPELPVAPSWYRVEPVGRGVARITEPHVDRYLEVNAWHLRGSERDLLVDTGNGIWPLRPVVEALSGGRPILAVVTHGHFDHTGGLHGFDQRACHTADAEEVRRPSDPLRLRRSDLSVAFLEDMAFYGHEPPEVMIRALPDPGFDLAGFSTEPTEPTRLLEDGDEIDLGDRTVSVLHLPGHTPGSIALLEPREGIVFTGDTAYLDDPIGIADADAFAASLERLRDLPIATIHPGHGRSFGPAELHALIASLGG